MTELTGVWAELFEALQSAPEDALDWAEAILQASGDETGAELIASERQRRETFARLDRHIQESQGREGVHGG